MRKSILMGLGLATVLASGAVAQQDAPRRGKGDGAKAGQFDKRGGAPDGFLLRGITLSETQKTQLKALRTTEREKVKATRQGSKGQMSEAKAARQRGDTAAARAIVQRNRLQMAQEREQHVAAVRNILTADQRVQFDKNVAEMKAHRQDRAAKGDPRGKKVGRFGG
jgi:Spy/CpxP family protein refolding chaperone